jgi:plastocyanin
VLALQGAVSAGDFRAKVVDQDGRAVVDAVVVVRSVTAADTVKAKPNDEVIEQIDSEFVPHVKAILMGSRVHFPNKDKVRHQVYSFSPARKFELPLYAGTTAAPILFDKPGVVTLGCNIHDWMIGYIYVADSPYFGKTGKEGTVLLTDLPAGDYDVRVWQPNMVESEDATLKRATLAKSGLNEAEWRITVKPAFKIRRAPAGGRGAYR